MLSQEHHDGARRDTGDDAQAAHATGSVTQMSAVARLLEMTARDTDQWRTDAEAEAASIVSAARVEASSLIRTAQDEAASTLERARREAAQSEAEVARLRQLASEHSQHLRQHLTEMLGRLDPAAPAGPEG